MGGYSESRRYNFRGKSCVLLYTGQFIGEKKLKGRVGGAMVGRARNA